MTEKMYELDNVRSGIMTGTMWDVMMKYITTDDASYSDLKSTPWGNYTNGVVTYTEGRGRYIPVNSSNGSTTANFTKSDNAYHYGIRTTASSEDVKKNNLYDIAGNLWEWTEEQCYVNNTNGVLKNLRGGGFNGSYADTPGCYRACGYVTYTFTSHGFRPALYIK